jgi:nicotinamidase-related amidase
VVSRNLQRLSEDLPVIAKVRGRWHITPLGRQVNVLNRKYLEDFAQFTGAKKKGPHAATLTVPENSLLVVINAQKALHDPARGRRSNLSAEENILRLLAVWRKKKRPIIHVKHASENPNSFFFRDGPGFDFIPNIEPRGKETLVEKSKASAFTGTSLEKLIRASKVEAVVLVGFTGGECIDATARQASDLGFRTIVVGDATATFDIVGLKGKLVKANKVHKDFLSHLQAMFAEVVDTENLL